MERNLDSLSPPETDLLDRYLAGTADPIEHQKVETWIAQHPEWGKRVDVLGTALRTIANSSGVTPDTAMRWAERILVEETATPALRPRVSRRVLTAAVGLVASAVLMIVGWSQGAQWLSQPIVGYKSSGVSVYSTGNGERATITLPDGSTTVLNVASQIEIPSDYDRGNRTIKLRGEALFTVTHHHGEPFTVVAGSSVTRVLGTSFTVRHYDTDTSAVVAVRDGKVSVGSVVLTAKQQATVNNIGTPTVSSARDEQFTFASGVLTLNEMPLKDAITELNRWYDADVRLGTAALATQRVKGTFATGSHAELAEILGLAFDVRVVRQGRILTLYAR